MGPSIQRMFMASMCVLFFLTACDSNNNEDMFEVTYEVPFNATNFQADVTHPLFPLTPGMVRTYEGQTEDGLERVVVEVLADTREVAGVMVTVVRDRVYLDGDLIEDTYDWFAQDIEGNVWYLGEDTYEIENGQIVCACGAWEAGVDGAEAGIIMPASPAVGQAYYQEYYAGEAEDRGRILALDVAVNVPTGNYTGCLKTEDTTPLEPDVLEHKYYCPGIGVIKEENLDDEEEIVLVDLVMP